MTHCHEGGFSFLPAVIGNRLTAGNRLTTESLLAPEDGRTPPVFVASFRNASEIIVFK